MTEALDNPRTRQVVLRALVALLGSVAVHALLVYGLSWLPAPEAPGLFIEFDVQDSELTGLGQQSEPEEELPYEEQGPEPIDDQGPPPPPPEPKPKREKKVEAATKDEGVVVPDETTEDKKPAAEEPDLAERGLPESTEVEFAVRDIPSIKSIAPGDAVMTMAIDVSVVRSSPYRAELTTLVQSTPDFHRVVGRSTVDPVTAYDKILITSADPNALSETLLLAETKAPEPILRRMIGEIVESSGGGDVEWSQEGTVQVGRAKGVWWAERGDPRVFVLPEDGILVFAKPELVPYLEKRKRRTRAAKGRYFPAMPKPLGGGTLPAAAVVEVSKVNVVMQGPAASLPPPAALRLVIHDHERPLVRVRLAFDSKEEAKTFATQWPAVQRQLASMWQLAVFGYTSLVERVELARDGDDAVYLEVRAEPREVKSILRLASRMIASHTRHLAPRPGDLPEPEPKPEAAAATPKADADSDSDAGSSGDAGLSATETRDTGEDTSEVEPTDERPAEEPANPAE